MSHKKFGPDRFSRFDVYWIQTNKQTDKPNLYIDFQSLELFVAILTRKHDFHWGKFQKKKIKSKLN